MKWVMDWGHWSLVPCEGLGERATPLWAVGAANVANAVGDGVLERAEYGPDSSRTTGFISAGTQGIDSNRVGGVEASCYSGDYSWLDIDDEFC